MHLVLGLALVVITLGAACWVGAAATHSWRRGLLVAAVAVGVVIAASTELLSLAHWLRPGPVTALWVALALVLSITAYSGARRNRRPPKLALDQFRNPLFASLIALLVLLVIVALTAAPNNIDSLVYHLSRVAHWRANASVGLYGTNDTRQLYMPPFAEFSVLHMLLLTGSDRSAAFVQLTAMVVTLVGVAELARLSGVSRKTQLLCVAVAAALPVGVAESVTTQTDYVVTCWVVCVAVGVMSASRGRLGALDISLVAGGAALAFATKATSLFYVPPLLLLLVWRCRSWRPLLLTAGVTAAVLAATSIGFTVRNADLYGNPLGPIDKSTRAEVSLQTVAENAIRDTALQLGVPSSSINAHLTKWVSSGMSKLGLSANDPRSTGESVQFRVDQGTREDNATDPIHVLLIAVFLVALATRWRRRFPRDTSWLAALTFAGWVMLCANQRWRPYDGRYLLTGFVLFAVPVGCLLSILHRRARAGILVVVFALAFAFIGFNDLRPLFGSRWLHAAGSPSVLTSARTTQYFNGRPWLEQPYRAAAKAVPAHAAVVGLSAAGDDFEYPLWVLLSQRLKDVRLVPVDVTGPAAHLAPRGWPRLTICTRPCQPPDPASWQKQVFGPVSVWERIHR